MARTLDTVEIHHWQVGKYTVAFAITPDGHHWAESAESPDAARKAIAEWLATLPAPVAVAAEAVVQEPAP